MKSESGRMKGNLKERTKQFAARQVQSRFH